MSGEGIRSVNWKNPMLLGDAHLRLADRCAAEARSWLARNVAPAVGSFGLVPPHHGGGTGLHLSHEHGADRLDVHVHAVSALAPDGTPLVFDEESCPELEGRLTASAVLEHNPPRPVRLGVAVEPVAEGENGAGFIEVGDVDTTEEPPRRPLRLPEYRLRVDTEAHSARSTLKVAEFVWDGVTVEPAADYLPPCLTVAASPELARTAVAMRKAITRLRETLVAAAAAPDGDETASLLADVVLPWAAALAAIEDVVPAGPAEVHPHAVWQAALRTLRVCRAMLAARPAALEHAIKTHVQEGKLVSGSTRYFEDLDRYLGEPYDHDRLGPTLQSGHGLLEAMLEVVVYLLGSAPSVEAAPAETDVYYYKDRKFKLARYAARTFELDEAWHTCFLQEMNVASPKSLLLVCDSDLLMQNPRPNAGLWMIDKFERVKANMFRVTVDNDSDRSKVVALFQDIGEPTVSAVSIASRGLLDLSGLGAEPDERVRVYYEG